MILEHYINGGDFASAGSASSSVKKVLVTLNLDPILIRRTVVSLYEAEVNVVAHAWEGFMVVEITPDQIKIEVRDNGPGIPDIKQAMCRGYSTANQIVREMGFGAGMGLPNIQDNSDSFTITSEINVGTMLQIVNKILEV